MAIDTPEKRASALNYGTPYCSPLPVADGTVDFADRAHRCAWYSGIVASVHDHAVVEAMTFSAVGRASADLTVRLPYVLRPARTWVELARSVHKLNKLLRRIDGRISDLE